jgi:hypothetical protein
VNLLIFVVDDEPDVEVSSAGRFRSDFRLHRHHGAFVLEPPCSRLLDCFE